MAKESKFESGDIIQEADSCVNEWILEKSSNGYFTLELLCSYFANNYIKGLPHPTFKSRRTIDSKFKKKGHVTVPIEYEINKDPNQITCWSFYKNIKRFITTEDD